jgi:hypothetical protein
MVESLQRQYTQLYFSFQYIMFCSQVLFVKVFIYLVCGGIIEMPLLPLKKEVTESLAGFHGVDSAVISFVPKFRLVCIL